MGGKKAPMALRWLREVTAWACQNAAESGDRPATPSVYVAVAALAVQAADLLTGDRAAVVDVPLAGVAAQVDAGACDARVDRTGDGWAVWTGSGPLEVAPPRSRPVTGRAAVLDAHGPALRDEFA